MTRLLVAATTKFGDVAKLGAALAHAAKPVCALNANAHTPGASFIAR